MSGTETTEAAAVQMVRAPFLPGQIKLLQWLQRSEVLPSLYCSRDTWKMHGKAEGEPQLVGWSSIIHQDEPQLRSVTAWGLVCPYCSHTLSEIPAWVVDAQQLDRLYHALLKTGTKEYQKFAATFLPQGKKGLKSAAEIALGKAKSSEEEAETTGIEQVGLLSRDVLTFALLVETRMLDREDAAAAGGEFWEGKRPWNTEKVPHRQLVAACQDDVAELGRILTQMAGKQYTFQAPPDTLVPIMGDVAGTMLALFDVFYKACDEATYKRLEESIRHNLKRREDRNKQRKSELFAKETVEKPPILTRIPTEEDADIQKWVIAVESMARNDKIAQGVGEAMLRMLGNTGYPIVNGMADVRAVERWKRYVVMTTMAELQNSKTDQYRNTLICFNRTDSINGASCHLKPCFDRQERARNEKAQGDIFSRREGLKQRIGL